MLVPRPLVESLEECTLEVNFNGSFLHSIHLFFAFGERKEALLAQLLKASGK